MKRLLTIATLFAALLTTLPVAAQQSEKEIKKAVKQLEKTAKSSDAKGQYDIALRFLNGDNIKQDTELARKWLNCAAKKGDAEMKYTVAHEFFKLSQSLNKNPKDYKSGESWLESAAKSGGGEMQIRVGDDYLNANDVPRDLSKAEDWYKKATKSTKKGYVSLGDLYYETYHNEKKAKKFYKKAGSLGIPRISYMENVVLYNESKKIESKLQDAKARWEALIPKRPIEFTNEEFDHLYNKALNGDADAANTYVNYIQIGGNFVSNGGKSNGYDLYSNIETLLTKYPNTDWAKWINLKKKNIDQSLKSLIETSAYNNQLIGKILYYSSHDFYEGIHATMFNDGGYSDRTQQKTKMRQEILDAIEKTELNPDLAYWLLFSRYLELKLNPQYKNNDNLLEETIYKKVSNLSGIDNFYYVNLINKGNNQGNVQFKYNLKEEPILEKYLNEKLNDSILIELSNKGFRPATVKLAIPKGAYYYNIDDCRKYLAKAETQSIDSTFLKKLIDKYGDGPASRTLKNIYAYDKASILARIKEVEKKNAEYRAQEAAREKAERQYAAKIAAVKKKIGARNYDAIADASIPVGIPLSYIREVAAVLDAPKIRISQNTAMSGYVTYEVRFIYSGLGTAIRNIGVSNGKVTYVSKIYYSNR